MNAVKKKRMGQSNVHDNGFVQQFRGVDIDDVQTKFFFRENLLCFHVLLKMKSGETVFFQEFKDYSEYINMFNGLLSAKSNGTVITFPDKIINSGSASPKVA